MIMVFNFVVAFSLLIFYRLLFVDIDSWCLWHRLGQLCQIALALGVTTGIFRTRGRDVEFSNDQITLFLVYLGLTAGAALVVLRVWEFKLNTTQKEMVDYLDQLQELRKILDNLDQPIIIFSNKIELANDMFFRQF